MLMRQGGVVCRQNERSGSVSRVSKTEKQMVVKVVNARIQNCRENTGEDKKCKHKEMDPRLAAEEGYLVELVSG